MYCKNCGEELKEGTTFCSKCGTKVENKNVVNEVKQQSYSLTQEQVPGVVLICGILGLVLSLISLLIALWGIVAIGALACSIVSLVMAKGQKCAGRGMAIAGIVISIVSLVFTVIVLIVGVGVLLI